MADQPRSPFNPGSGPIPKFKEIYMVYLKLKSERLGDYVHEQIFIGPDKDHLALAGKLVLQVGEWQDFGCCLLLGSQQMRGRLVVECVGDNEVVGGEPGRTKEINQNDPSNASICKGR